MCGIAGFVGPGDAATLDRMTGALAHRGPDDVGFWRDERHAVGLGHRRLAIIDCSAGGHQPMSFADGRYRIVYNGELYNYRELRDELQRGGASFHTRSDTEVLVAAYAAWGPACLDRLRGMFAFAIWDAGAGGGGGSEPHLFLARDRFGVKPLLYALTGGRFSFASELRAFLTAGLVSRRMDPQAVWDYLSYGSVPQPRTILADVRALPPGCWARVRPGVEPEFGRYWDLAEAARGRAVPTDEREAVVELRRLLDDAARAHLIADVPVGAFLSGGLDSTAVVGLMSQFVTHPIRTFSVGFETRYQRYSELEWAALAARRFGTRHEEVIVTETMIGDSVDALVRAIDQPSLDGTNTYFVSRATRTGVTVSLSGIGGDELFAGYPHFERLARADRYFPRGVSWAAKAVAAMAPARLSSRLSLLGETPVQRYAGIRRIMTEAEKRRALSAALGSRFSPRPVTRLFDDRLRDELDSVAQTSYVEATTYLPNTLLRDADAMSMAHSLEVRPVLLDHPLAEFAFALPGRLKLQRGATKHLLREAVKDLVPPEINNRAKRGFELPMSEWLGGPLRARAREELASGEARSVFDARFLRSLDRSLVTGRPHPGTWSYLVLFAWMREWGCEL